MSNKGGHRTSPFQKTFLLIISQMPEGILVISQALKVYLVS